MVVTNTIVLRFLSQSLRILRAFSLTLYIDGEKVMCQTAMRQTATYFGDFKSSRLPYSSCRRSCRVLGGKFEAQYTISCL